jgi:hypothetical protein
MMKKNIVILSVCLSMAFPSCVSVKRYNEVKKQNRVLTEALDVCNKTKPAPGNGTKISELQSEKDRINSLYLELEKKT